MIAKFLQTYGLTDSNTLMFLYGSRVYGTNKENSDYDYIAVIPDNHGIVTGTEYRNDLLNVHMTTNQDFQTQLDQHKIQPLECWFLPGKAAARDRFKFTLDKVKLRHELSEKASHSFVKAKKKIEVEKDFYIGWKSLFHSLRILDFGIQIATSGRIEDYSRANHLWFEILESNQYNWAYFQEKYKPIYNQLASQFRLLAPKDE